MNYSPEKLLEIRKTLGLRQSQAADIVSCTTRSWQGWEYGERPMHQGMWELFLLKTRQATVDQVLEWDRMIEAEKLALREKVKAMLEVPGATRESVLALLDAE